MVKWRVDLLSNVNWNAHPLVDNVLIVVYFHMTVSVELAEVPKIVLAAQVFFRANKYHSLFFVFNFKFIFLCFAHLCKTKWKKVMQWNTCYYSSSRERHRERNNDITDDRWQVSDERRHYKWGFFFYCHYRLSFLFSLTGIKCIWSKKKRERAKAKTEIIQHTDIHIGWCEERKKENQMYF
jgi:hypothetical protein